MNKNSYKYSGLANAKAVGIQFDKDAKGRPCAAMCLKVRCEKPDVGLTNFGNDSLKFRQCVLPDRILNSPEDQFNHAWKWLFHCGISLNTLTGYI